MVEETVIRKITTGIIIVIIIITGFLSGCNEQNQHRNFVNNAASGNNTSLQENQPPVASCSANTTFGCAPLSVSFQGSGTDADGMIISYHWDFGDGNTSFEQNPSHLYNKTGMYIVILTVSDDDGASDTDYTEISVMSEPNYLLTADFTYRPSSPSDLDVIHFTDQSTDGDGHIMSWSWDFGDGGTSTLQNPTYDYADNGTYHVTLTVLDDDGESNAVSKDIIVSNVPPTAQFTYSPSAPSVLDVVKFTDQSIDGDGYIMGWSWDFGDGASSSEQHPSHHYVNTGTYEVTLTVNDNDDSASETVKEIMIYEQSNGTTILTLTYNGDQKTYTLEDVENMVSITGYGGRINKVGSIEGPFEYKGVPIAVLADEFSLIPTSYTLTTVSTDGYIYNYTEDEIQGNIQVYDTEGNEQGIGGVTMILAYEEDGIQDFPGGPLRIAYVADDEQLTDAFRWSKYVTEIDFFDI
jgi:PKD repeat protein